MFGDYVPNDKELKLFIEWGAYAINQDSMSPEGKELYKKILKLKQTREHNSKAWNEFSKELEY
jgi:hypothetical protein